MKIRLLGTGTSTGVPELGCACEVCTSTDVHDNRLRTSAFVEVDGKNILIDCGPDFRTQMLRCDYKSIDAVLLTHHHYDHIAGIDDLRPFCRSGAIDIYAESDTLTQVRNFFPYCFAENKYPGVPNIATSEICAKEDFYISDIAIKPIRVFHGKLPILGFRIKNLAYITDMKYIDSAELEKLQGVELLVINALRFAKPHQTHQTVLDALRIIDIVKPRRTYFTHMMHHIGLHAKIEKCLPENVFLGYDNMVIEV